MAESLMGWALQDYGQGMRQVIRWGELQCTRLICETNQENVSHWMDKQWTDGRDML